MVGSIAIGDNKMRSSSVGHDRILALDLVGNERVAG